MIDSVDSDHGTYFMWLSLCIRNSCKEKTKS